MRGRRSSKQFGKKGHGIVSNNEDHDPLRLDATTHEYLWLNPRGVRKAPRKKVPYDGKPTLHAPGCKSIARTEESKRLKVPSMTLNLFDRSEVWYCQNCLVVKSTA